MALTLIQVADLFDDVAFRKRVKGAIINLCAEIAQEPETTANHEARVRARDRLMNDLDMSVSRVMPLVVEQAAFYGIGTNTTDAQITTAVTSAIQAYAS